MSDVTVILERAQQGDPHAVGELLPLVYDELRKLAAHQMSTESPDDTLQPTALVHEVWLRLVRGNDQSFENRRHFFAAAAQAMRRILIERARYRHRACHGGQLQRVGMVVGHRHRTRGSPGQAPDHENPTTRRRLKQQA